MSITGQTHQPPRIWARRYSKLCHVIKNILMFCRCRATWTSVVGKTHAIQSVWYCEEKDRSYSQKWRGCYPRYLWLFCMGTENRRNKCHQISFSLFSFLTEACEDIKLSVEVVFCATSCSQQDLGERHLLF